MIESFLNEMVSKLPELHREYRKIYLKDKIDEKALNDILIKLGLISIEIKNSEKSEICYKFSLYADSLPDIFGLDIFIGSHIKLDAEKSCICIYDYDKNIISGMKKILFREKILDEVYDKAGEYSLNTEKYEANTDDIIEKIEEERYAGLTGFYNLFIIKHFIKFVMDKYKQENISSEDNSSNENIENTEETKNINNNPFINDEE